MSVYMFRWAYICLCFFYLRHFFNLGLRLPLCLFVPVRIRTSFSTLLSTNKSVHHVLLFCILIPYNLILACIESFLFVDKPFYLCLCLFIRVSFRVFVCECVRMHIVTNNL